MLAVEGIVKGLAVLATYIIYSAGRFCIGLHFVFRIRKKPLQSYAFFGKNIHISKVVDTVVLLNKRFKNFRSKLKNIIKNLQKRLKSA